MAAGDGLISMTPTSITHSGTSASINADGGVDFTAVTSLSLNGVFTGDYDNYLLTIDLKCDSSGENFYYRLRASGTDATATNYTRQKVYANGSSVTGFRFTSQSYAGGEFITNTTRNGMQIHIYGPNLAQPTAFRSVTGLGDSGAALEDFASTHSLSTAYDGITVLITQAFTGTVHVFGYEE